MLRMFQRLFGNRDGYIPFPTDYAWVGEDEGEPVGPELIVGPFAGVSTVRDQIPLMIQHEMQRLVLADGMRANGFRFTKTEWWHDGFRQIARYQPVWIEPESET